MNKLCSRNTGLATAAGRSTRCSLAVFSPFVFLSLIPLLSPSPFTATPRLRSRASLSRSQPARGSALLPFSLSLFLAYTSSFRRRAMLLRENLRSSLASSRFPSFYLASINGPSSLSFLLPRSLLRSRVVARGAHGISSVLATEQISNK